MWTGGRRNPGHPGNPRLICLALLYEKVSQDMAKKSRKDSTQRRRDAEKGCFFVSPVGVTTF